MEDDDLPSIQDVLPICTLVANTLQLAHSDRPVCDDAWDSVQPSKSAAADAEEVAPGIRAPVQHKSRKTAAPVAAPSAPYMAETNRRLWNMPVFSSTGPMFHVSPNLPTLVEMGWAQSLRTITLDTLNTGAPAKEAPPVPFVTVLHDNEQLRIGRRSRATNALLHPCENGPECCALTFRGVSDPLHTWLTPTEEIRFHETGEAPKRTCLLCIRSATTALKLVYGTTAHGSAVQDTIHVVFPFVNRVNCPDGYCPQYVITPRDLPLLPGPIVQYTPGLLRFESTKMLADGHHEGRFVQDLIVWKSAVGPSN